MQWLRRCPATSTRSSPRIRGERHVLSHHVLQTLDQCREFRPIDEHAARVASVVPGLTQQDRIRKGLEGLATAGLLVKDSDYLDRLRRAPEASPRTLHAIYIRACDRPQQLKKLLDSLANYERKFRVARPVVLLDDSTDARNQDQNRDLLREFARAVGNPVSYFGPSERQRLRERLLKAVPGCEKSLEWFARSRSAHAPTWRRTFLERRAAALGRTHVRDAR